MILKWDLMAIEAVHKLDFSALELKEPSKKELEQILKVKRDEF